MPQPLVDRCPFEVAGCYAAGADASVRGKDSRTALEHAEARGHADVAALLRGAEGTDADKLRRRHPLYKEEIEIADFVDDARGPGEER